VTAFPLTRSFRAALTVRAHARNSMTKSHVSLPHRESTRHAARKTGPTSVLFSLIRPNGGRTQSRWATTPQTQSRWPTTLVT
jgi:hypothetical protein